MSGGDRPPPLSLAPDSDVFLLKRIRYVDDDAVSMGVLGTGRINPPIRTTSASRFTIIPQPGYSSFTSARSRVSARMPDSEFQAHIKMDDKIPVLVIKQVALDQQHRPIEYSISYCRSDLYVFVCSGPSRVGAQSPPRWLIPRQLRHC